MGEQLLAESTGKEGRGIVPVDGEGLGSPDVYSPDRVFVYMQLAGSDEATTATQLAALEAAGHPVVRISIPGAIALGGEFFRWEVATATAGAILYVNPFDEPDVDESKQRTHDLLSARQRQELASPELPLIEADGVAVYGDAKHVHVDRDQTDSMREVLQAVVGQMQAPDYLALLPYFQRTPPRHEALQAIRGVVRNRYRVATMLGYGPRYLHSTGQLHKGGPNTAVFIMITADASEDIPIPGQPYGFATLHRAQALGDFLTLIHKQRRAIRGHLGKDIEGGLKQIGEHLQ